MSIVLDGLLIDDRFSAADLCRAIVELRAIQAWHQEQHSDTIAHEAGKRIDKLLDLLILRLAEA